MIDAIPRIHGYYYRWYLIISKLWKETHHNLIYASYRNINGINTGSKIKEIKFRKMWIAPQKTIEEDGESKDIVAGRACN